LIFIFLVNKKEAKKERKMVGEEDKWVSEIRFPIFEEVLSTTSAPVPGF
jgi:hypothetical protein